VGGVLLADGTECKVLTGIDDHFRYCVCAGVMTRDRHPPADTDRRARRGGWCRERPDGRSGSAAVASCMRDA
jgi:hypothetical protein